MNPFERNKELLKQICIQALGQIIKMLESFFEVYTSISAQINELHKQLLCRFNIHQLDKKSSFYGRIHII